MNRYEEIMRAVNPSFLPTVEQREVILSDQPAILVVAGAGAGKTATMANRIAYQVATGKVAPDEVLGLTFTRKAAGELAERVDCSLGRIRAAGLYSGGEAANLRDGLARPTVSTYNSFASEIATSHGMLVGQDTGARLITDGERWQIMSAVLDSVGSRLTVLRDSSRSTIIGKALNLASSLIDNGRAPEELRAFYESEQEAIERMSVSVPKRITAKNTPGGAGDWKDLKNTSFRKGIEYVDLIEEYLAVKKREGLIEFADQVTVASAVLERFPLLGAELSSRYRLVLLDEYQDTSINQARFIKNALGKPGDEWRSVCAVGDPNQAIYGWRGASANALADFAHDFASREHGGVQRLTLSTSFRSDHAILTAANAVAAGLATDGQETSGGSAGVHELSARPGAGPGRVVEIRPLTREDSYRAIAWRIRDVFEAVARAQDRGERDLDADAEIAVLCRNRSFMDPLIDMLGELGLPYEVVGGASAIERPEILTLRAALGVIVAPRRNDLLVRLFHHWALGSDDLRVMRAWSLEYASRQIQQIGASEFLDTRGEAGLVEAMRELPPRHWTTREGLSLSEGGRCRLQTINAVLGTLRTSSHLPLPDLVGYAAVLLGLDILAATRGEGSQRVQTTLDSFIAMARGYENDHPGCSLRDFVEWLDAVEAHEHGGEEASGEDPLPSEDIEVHAGVVQVMTIHAAKGLEWRDLVVVPEMVKDKVSERSGNAHNWVTRDAYPYPLRADYRYLPEFAVSSFESFDEAGRAYASFRREGLVEHENREARRLAYVAFTRPTEELLLAGYALDGPTLKEAHKHREDGASEVSSLARSSFLEDIRGSGVAVGIDEVSTGSAHQWPQELIEVIDDDIEVAELESRHLFDTEDEAAEVYAMWPDDIRREIPTGPVLTTPDDWRFTADLLLGELRAPAGTELGREYVTATDVVHLADDPEAFLRQQRRPIPVRPSRAARTGTELHARIAAFFEKPATLDIDSVMEQGEMPVDQEAVTREGEQSLMEAFEAGPWSGFDPIAIEESISVVIGGHIVRCTIDAVLDTSSAADLTPVTIIDWKTGRKPREEELRARQLQLAIYRIAWARTHDVPLEEIGAYFVYLREPEEKQVVAAAKLSEEEIAEQIELALASTKANIDSCDS